MKNRITAFAIWAAIAVGVIGLAFAASDAYWSSDQNGRLWSLKSGGEINIESGATLKFAGTEFTASDYVLDSDLTTTLADYAPLASPSFTGTVELPANVGAGTGTAFDTAGDTTYFTFNATGGGGVLFLIPPGIPSGATLPTCSASVIPAGSVGLAYDTTGPDLCICNGTSWAPADGSGTCA